MFESILRLFKKEENSKNVAKERLKLVLIHDKANVSPQFLEMVKGEIIKVIRKYMEIDEELLDIQLTKTKSDAGDRVVPALVANIPILRRNIFIFIVRLAFSNNNLQVIIVQWVFKLSYWVKFVKF